MRVAVDATCWSNRRGYGRFARALLTSVVSLDHANHYVFLVDDDSKEFPLPENAEVVRVSSARPTVKAASANGRRSLHDMWTVRRALENQKADLVFFPSVYSYVPLAKSTRNLLTIHDAIPELYPELVFPTWRSKLFWRSKVRLGCSRATLVLTVSEYSRRCLVEKLGISPSRIRVVNEAASPAFHRLGQPDSSALFARLGLPQGARFLVYVGGFSPHKNLALLVDVFRELQAQPQFCQLRLVLVGDYEGDVFYSCYQPLLSRVRQTGLSDKVLFTGHLGDADLIVLLNLAEALILPSFSEGFGLPAVEAAACGTPVVVTTQSPLPELLGRGALAVDPDDRPGWFNAIARILSEPELQARMREAGLAAARRLSWENSARQLVSLFDEVVRHGVAAR